MTKVKAKIMLTEEISDIYIYIPFSFLRFIISLRSWPPHSATNKRNYVEESPMTLKKSFFNYKIRVFDLRFQKSFLRDPIP